MRLAKRLTLGVPQNDGGGGGGGDGDPYFANVTSLLHFDGADGSTTITDNIGNVWTVNGNAQIDTAQSKFGGASMLLDGTGDWINSGSAAAFGFGAGDFTIEGWFRPSSLAAANICLLDTRTGANEGIAIYASGSAVGNTFSAYSNAGPIGGGDVDVFIVNTWSHFAVVRQGTTVRGYLDGVQAFNGTDARTYASASTCVIGDNYLAPSQPAAGWLDDFRITKGVCRYPDGTTFTVPAAPFPDS